jgi:hypothetical protein
MKQTNVFKSILIAFKHSLVSSCLTIFRSVFLVLLSASFLTACNPSTTNNHNTYEAGKAGMSGGGATKDPGDGTGGSTGDGGGGQGVQCGESKKSELTNRLFVRDIYEAINNHKLQIKSIPNDVAGTETVSKAAIKILTDSIRSYYGPASSKLDFTKDNFWTDFIQRISFLDDEKELFPSQDANSPIALPKECKIVQIAYWDDSSGQSEDGTLYVSRKLWSAMDQTNKIGLLAHEYFFKAARRALYKNSDSTRSKVGQLLSTQGLPVLFKNWETNPDSRIKNDLPSSKRGFKVCEGSSTEDSNAKMLLYQYQGSDNLQHFVIPILQSTSVNANPFQSSNFIFDPVTSPDINAATDLFLYQSMLLPPEGRDWSYNELPLWIDRWFDGSGLLSKKLNHNSYEGFNRLSKELYYKKQVLWMDYLTPAPKSLKISLLNSFFNQKADSEKSLKKRDELIPIINKQLTQKLNKCRVRGERHLVDAAIAALHSEIAEAQRTGKYPEDFPLWHTSLESIENTYQQKKKDKPPSSTCKILDDGDVTSSIPFLLYKIYLNNYTAKDTEDLLGDQAFAAAEIPYAGPGKIRASQEGINVDFDLKCKDYGMLSEELNRTREDTRAENPVYEKEVTLAPLVFDSEDEELDSDELNEPRAIARRNAREESRKKTQMTFEYLTKLFSFKEKISADDQFRYWENPYVKGSPEAVESFIAVKDLQMIYFVSSLKRESKLNIEQCEWEYFAEELKITNISCATITMKTLNLKFQIYFSSDLFGPDFLQVSFAKVLAPVQILKTEREEVSAPIIRYPKTK